MHNDEFSKDSFMYVVNVFWSYLPLSNYLFLLLSHSHEYSWFSQLTHLLISYLFILCDLVGCLKKHGHFTSGYTMKEGGFPLSLYKSSARAGVPWLWQVIDGVYLVQLITFCWFVCLFVFEKTLSMLIRLALNLWSFLLRLSSVEITGMYYHICFLLLNCRSPFIGVLRVFRRRKLIKQTCVETKWNLLDWLNNTNWTLAFSHILALLSLLSSAGAHYE